MPAKSHRPTPQKLLRSDVLEVLREVAYGYTHGVPALAAKICMPPGTLYNKLNTHDTSAARPTVADLIQITAITGNPAAVIALNNMFGMVAIPVPNLAHVSDEALLELVNRIGAEGGDFYRAMNDALAGRHMEPAALAKIHKEGWEFIGAILETMERTKGLLDG